MTVIAKRKRPSATLADAKASASEFAVAAIIDDVPTLRVIAAWVAFAGRRTFPDDCQLENAWRRAWPRGVQVARLANMAGLTSSMILERLEALKSLGVIFPDGTVSKTTEALLRSEIMGLTEAPGASRGADKRPAADYGKRVDYSSRRERGEH